MHKIPKAQKRKMKISFTKKFTNRMWDDEREEERKEKGEKKEKGETKGGKNLRLEFTKSYNNYT